MYWSKTISHCNKSERFSHCMDEISHRLRTPGLGKLRHEQSDFFLEFFQFFVFFFEKIFNSATFSDWTWFRPSYTSCEFSNKRYEFSFGIHVTFFLLCSLSIVKYETPAIRSGLLLNHVNLHFLHWSKPCMHVRKAFTSVSNFFDLMECEKQN